MPYYKYEIRDAKGVFQTSQTYADNKTELIKTFQNTGCLIISITELGTTRKARKRKMHKKAKTEDLLVFAKQLALLLDSGIPLLDTLGTVTKQIQSVRLLEAAEAVKKDVEGGNPLSESFGKWPKIFESFWRDVLRAGEISGQMALVIRKVSDYIRAREEIKKKIINAFIYPCILLVFAVIAVLIFLYRIIPVFEKLFESFNLKLPEFTQALIDLSHFLRERFFISVFIIGFVVFITKAFLKTPAGQKALTFIFMRLPVVGDFFMAMTIKNFSSILGMLLTSGVPIIQALEIAADTSGNLYFQQKLHAAKTKITNGTNVTDSFEETELFPAIAMQLITVGEKTGNIGGMMDEINDYYSDILDTLTGRLAALLEPIMLIFIAIIIGSLVIAMFLPILKMANIGM
ncbi:MAG: type II secretion system F family protein [Candidatus Omnitrophica bacterium]|nr:type II secretion system F family protein [Candidatus Omnitrophota bacterium]